MSSNKELSKRIVRSIHIILYLILAGIGVFTYFQARQTYNVASLDNSYIVCDGVTNTEKFLDGTRFSLRRLDMQGQYTVNSTTLNGWGQQTDDDLLADKTCDTSYGQTPASCIGIMPSSTNETQSFMYGLCNDHYHGPTGTYTVHFAHNDTLEPTWAVELVVIIGVVIIELLSLILMYVVTGRKSL